MITSHHLRIACLLALALVAALHIHNRAWAQKPGARANSRVPVDRPELVVQLGFYASSMDAAAFSPDGRLVLTGSAYGTLSLWDLASAREVRRLGTGAGRAATFSPDGRFVFAPAEHLTAKLWDVSTSEVVQLFQGSYIDSAAFSPDGRFILTANASASDTTARLWDVATGKVLRQFEGVKREKLGVLYYPVVSFSPDARFILTSGADDAVRLWSSKTGNEVRRFQGHSGYVLSAEFSPDGRQLLTSGADNTVRVWDVATGREVRRFSGKLAPTVTFMPDGRSVISTHPGESDAQVLDIATGNQIRRFQVPIHWFRLAFSPDRQFILLGPSALSGSGVDYFSLWDTATGDETRRFQGYSDGIRSAVFSPDGRFIMTNTGRIGDSWDLNAVHVWDTTTGNVIRRYDRASVSPDGRFVLQTNHAKGRLLLDSLTGSEIARVKRGFSELLAWSPDGQSVLALESDKKTPILFSLAANREILRLQKPGVKLAAFSPDGRLVLTAGGSVDLWDAQTGQKIRTIIGPRGEVTSIAFSPNSNFVLITSNWDIELWDLALHVSPPRQDLGHKGFIRRFVGHKGYITSATFSLDGRYIASSSQDNTLRLWDIASGQEIRQMSGEIGRIMFSPDGELIVGIGGGAARLVNVTSMKEVCQMVVMRDGIWAVVDPEGRLDTNNLEEIRGLNWVMPDDPMRALPLEIFMRDYYEPRLLARIINGEQFKPVRSLADLNRVQPIVKITGIERQKDNPELVTVTVEVSRESAKSGRAGNKIGRETGVYDLRLFRNGQIVGQSPRASATTGASAITGGDDQTQELLAWRQSAQVKLDRSGKQFIKFENIHLPRRADLKQVEFSAYAFNWDRVISQTDRKVFDLPKDLAPVKGRAYIITVGVNAYENSDWNLRFAADDARITQAVLSQKLRQSADYLEVVSISLLSDFGPNGQVIDKSATKANFKAVLDMLAGRKIDTKLLGGIADADKLRKVTPEDLVIISIASHADADKQGNFYLLPYDIGSGRGQSVTAKLLTRCISSEELSLWLRDVDAGEMVMIVDACHSAASVEQPGFKPGPMGSRGLGQLAYDKGMRILAASQADDVAIESEQVRQGLLTYALIRDGIEAFQADSTPQDRRITLEEWLRYGAGRVPDLYEEVKRGEVKRFGRGQRAKIVLVKQGRSLKRAAQQPQLFDFARKRREVVLVK